MQQFKAFFRVKDRIKTKFLLCVAICQVLGWFPFTSILFGHPAGSKALAGGNSRLPATAPAAPSNLALMVVSHSRLDLAWTDNSSIERGFEIERRLSTSTVYTLVETLGSDVEIFSDTGLAGSSKYFYRIRAFNDDGYSSYSNIVSGITPPTPPAAPSGLAATPESTKQIDLAWADNSSNEEGFEIERKLGTTAVYARIATIGPNFEAFSDSGLTQNTKYFYRVRAFNAGGKSDYSSVVSATTLPTPPKAPSQLVATRVSSSQINLAWQDKSDNEAGFRIERKIPQGGTGTYLQVALVGANVTSFSSATLSPNTKYYYRVRAYNLGGESAYSNEASATTLPTTPLAPGGLTATTVSNTRINLAWQDNATNEDSFKIERRKGAAGLFAPIAVVGANVKKFADSSLAANTMYFYRMRAFNIGGYSDYSNEASATTLPDRPQAPGHLTATTVSNMQIDLAWQDHATNEDSFKIERKVGAAGKYVKIATLEADAKNFSDKKLAATTEYFYRLAAANRGGLSDYSNEAGAKTFPNPPGAPSNLIATTISNSRINLAWRDNATNEEGFQIERKKGGSAGSPGAYVQIAIAGANVKQFADSSLPSNTLYFYRLRAFNTGNHTDYSSEASATTLPDRPAAPSNLTATTVSNTQINLAWQDHATNEDSFKIERKMGGSTGSPGKYVKIAALGANVKSFSDKSLAANTEYFYRLRAANIGGQSDYSNEANTTTFPNPPAAPGNLTTTTVSYNRINLAWTDSSNNEDGFKIERSLVALGAFAEIAQVGANVTSFADSGLTGNKKYFYRLRAHNAGGHSDYSAVVGSTTLPNPPAAPGNLRATLVTHNRIILAWQDKAANEDGFKVERKIGAAGTYEEIIAVGANVTSYANTGLPEKTQYFYRVRAYNAGGPSDYSDVIEVTTLPIPPASPGRLTATTASNSRINLAWTDSSNNEAGFKIERKSGGSTGSPGTFVELAKVDANITSYSDSSLAGNTTYFYRLRAFNPGGHSGYTNETKATTLPNPPAAPANLIAIMVSHNFINLAWQDNSSNETGFKIERKTGGAGKYEEIIVVGANATRYSNTGLAEKTQYFYRVRAYNAGGHSGYSTVLEVATPPIPPVTPGQLAAATVSNTQINLTWQDKSTNEDSFEIERKIGSTGSPGTYAVLTKAGANVTSYSDKNLVSNTTYFYRVRAFNAGGYSDYSNEANTTTLPNRPATPGQLIATTVSSNQINLTWQDQSTNEDSFKIERKLGAAGKFAVIATLNANTNKFADTALAANTPYFYRLRAYNRGGFSDYSNEASAATLPITPAVPRNLTATAMSNTRINLAWADSANNEVGFEIERRLSTAAAYTKMATVEANIKSYADNNLAVNTAYFYRVRAFNAGGYSDYSNETSATTLPNPPVTPGQLIATTVSNTQVNLKWQDNSANEDSFKIERKLGTQGAYKQIAALRANTKSFADTALAANTSYFYRVRAYNTGGHSSYSNEANAMTLPNRPAAPSQLTATTVSNSRINLTWQDKATNEDSFKIERTIAGGGYAEVAKVGANVTSYSDNSVAANTMYFYRVRAFNAGGHSNYSNEANATTLPNPPAAPGQLTASTVSNKQIDLAWQDKSANEDSFKIERKVGAAGVYKQIAASGANGKNFSDMGLAPNTEYFYRVRAYNRGGFSDYSNEASAATLPNAPAKPGSLQATTISQNQINLVWADSASNEVGFKIERKTIVGVYAPIATVNANASSYTDSGLEQDTGYFYRVRAYNSGGASAYSNEVHARTLPIPPAAPGGLKATMTGSSQIDLAWADSSNNETGFKIERKTLQGSFAEIALTGANVTSYSNLDLISNTRYFYRVRAYNRGDYSAYSNIAEATTLPKPPAAPAGLVATAVANLKIELTWLDKSSNEDSFQIERRIGAAGAYAQIAKAGKEATSYSDIDLKPVTQYFYRVRAANSGGASAYSNEANTTTLLRPPAAPKNLIATTVSNSRLRLVWADSSNDESGFKIERKTPQSGGAYVEIVTLGPNVKSLSDSSLSGNTEYSYRLRAYNSGGHSGYSNEAGATTLPDPPAGPTSLTAAPESNTKINLAWLDNSDNETGFKIERKIPQGGTSGAYAQIATVDVNAKSFTDSSLTGNTGYFYRIRAFNAGGHSGYSNEVNTKTLPNSPLAPNHLTATTVSVRRINLAWADNSNNEFGFKIERKTGAVGVYREIMLVDANVKRFADSSLTGKTTYFYRVRAFNGGGNSPYTNEASATTLPYPPLAPDNLTITSVSHRQIKLTWSDNSSNESGFRIERKATAAGTYAVVAAVNATVTSIADTGLAALTPYFYRVFAFNAGGNSGYSNEESATTLPNPPVAPDSLITTPVSHLRINLKWKDLSDNENGFQIERKIGAGGKFVQIASVGAGVTDFFDSNLAANKEYFYRVRAFNAGGLSNYTNEVKSMTLPIPPGSLTGNSLSNRRLTITWTDSSSNESGFRIERRLFETEFAEIGFVGTNVRTYADTNLTPNTVYYYRVRAFNFGGLSAYSNEAAVGTLPNPPARPRALNVMRLPNLRLRLAWADSSNNEIGFTIERKLATDTAFAEVGIVNANVTTHLDSALLAETRYFYRVRAFNTGGYSLYSNEDNNVTLIAPPAAPSELIATIGNSTRINLVWTDNSDDESGFKIERKLVNDTTYAEIAAVGANVRSYSDNGLTEDTAYMYRVRAFNEGGTSNYSDEVNAIPANDTNLALNKSALASSADIVGTSNRTVDGNLTTFWRSGTINTTSPHVWLRVELHPNSQIIIDRVVIRWYQTFFALEYEIQTSDNGVSWTTIYTNETGTIGTQEITFAQTPARFVRLYMKRGNKANYRVTEFEVYNGFAKAARHATANDAIIPETVTLRPNYPNPFSANGTSGNPTTTISYGLPEGMQVTLKVLNVAGQEVATLVDRRQERGIYHVTFSGRKLPSGVYFTVLQAGEVRQVQRMLLAK